MSPRSTNRYGYEAWTDRSSATVGGLSGPLADASRVAITPLEVRYRKSSYRIWTAPSTSRPNGSAAKRSPPAGRNQRTGLVSSGSRQDQNGASTTPRHHFSR